MAHEYSFLAGFLQEVDTGVSTGRSSQGRTFKHESGGSGSMPRPRLLRLTSCTLFPHPPSLPFLLLFHPLRCLQPRPSENPLLAPLVVNTDNSWKNRVGQKNGSARRSLDTILAVANWFFRKRTDPLIPLPSLVTTDIIINSTLLRFVPFLL